MDKDNREWNPDISNIIDGPEDHHIKWNKPGTEKKDLTISLLYKF
jgi:hypothetical protein